MTEGFSLLNAAARVGKDRWTFVSTEDIDVLRERNWHLNNGYARAGTTKKYLHRLLIRGAAYVDHINGDRLDNRRCNLRKADAAQNSRNQTRKASGMTSRFKGVYWAAWAKRWRAEITVDYRAIKLGYFDTEQQAQDAYAAAAARLHGAFAAPRVRSK